MSFCTKNRQTTSFFYTWSEFNIRTATSHVCCNSYSTCKTCFSYNLGFTLVLFCIQYIMWNLLLTQHSTDKFTNLNRGSTDKNWSSCITLFFYLINYSLIFFSLSFINKILLIFSYRLNIGWNVNYIQFINAPQL